MFSMNIVLQSKFLLLINYSYSSKHYLKKNKQPTYLLNHLSLLIQSVRIPDVFYPPSTI